MYLDLTGADPVKIVQAAYALSSPQGLGFLHVREGELSDEEAKQLVDQDRRYGIHLDYVHGRACKFHLLTRDGKLYTPARWYDHSDWHVEQLLKRLGLERREVSEEVVYPPRAQDLED